LPPIDTIYSHDRPQAALAMVAHCPGQGSELKSLSRPIEGKIKKLEWFVDGNPLDTGTQVNYFAPKPGEFALLLIAETEFGCRDSSWGTLQVPGVSLSLLLDDTLLCVGSPLKLEADAQTYFDVLRSFYWDYGDGVQDSLSGSPAYYRYSQIGKYQP